MMNYLFMNLENAMPFNKKVKKQETQVVDERVLSETIKLYKSFSLQCF